MRARPTGGASPLGEVATFIREMPRTMKQLACMRLFQWYALFCYWQYIVLCLARTLFHASDPASAGFRDAGLLNGKIGAFYNFIALLAAFAVLFVRVTREDPDHA